MKLEKFILDISSPFNLIKTKSGNISLRLIEGTSIEAIDIIDRINLHEELIEAIKMELWALRNGEAEAQKQGKPRLATRWEILENILQKATNKTQGGA